MAVKLDEIKILVVDDQLLVRTLISQMLRNFGLKQEAVFQATDGNNALHVLAARHVHLVLCDMQMAPINGMDLLKLIRCGRTQNSPDLPFVFLSGHPERQNILLASQLHADGFIVKPPKPQDIEKHLHSALERQRPTINPFGYFTIQTGSDFDQRTFERQVVPKQSHDLDLILTRFLVSTPLEKVEPGAILAQDLVSNSGQPLLPRGVKINQMQLEALRRFQSLYGIQALPIANLPQDQMIMYQEHYGISL